MSAIYVMIPAAFLLAGLGIWAFVRAVRAGQFDDLDTPPLRVIFGDDEAAPDRDTPDRPAPG